MIGKRWIGWLGLGAALAVGAHTGEAAACGACVCNDAGSQPLVTLVRDVPLNLVVPLRMTSEAETPPALERVSDDSAVPAEVTRVDGQPYWLMTVSESLVPNTEYRIVREGGVEAQFTTGAEPDVDAPQLGAVTASSGSDGAECDTVTGARLELTGAGDGNRLDVWVEVELRVGGEVRTLFARHELGQLLFGHSEMGCLGDNELSWVEADAQYPTRVRLHDLGGHTTDWQSLVVTMASTEPAGCGSPDPIQAGAGAGGKGGGAPAVSGGAGGNESSPEPNDASDPRTSQGCGCSLAGHSHAGLGAALVAFALLTYRRRFRARI